MPGSLFDHDADALALLDLLAAHDGDEDAQRAVFDEYLAAEERVAKKLDNTAGLIHELEQRARVWQAEGDRWKTRADASRAKARRLREHLQRYLEGRGADRVRGDRFDLRLVLAGGKRGVLVEDETRLPPALLESKLTTRPKLDEIRERLEGGQDVPGASLKPRKRTLRIR